MEDERTRASVASDYPVIAYILLGMFSAYLSSVGLGFSPNQGCICAGAAGAYGVMLAIMVRRS